MVRKKTLYFAVLAAFSLGFYVGSLAMMVREDARGGRNAPAIQAGAVANAGQGAGQAGMPYEAEERRLRDLTGREPQNPVHWVALGNLYFDTHRPVHAIEAYARSLDLQPEQPEVLVDKGIMHLASGDPGEAVRHFDKALAFRPGFQPALMNKGIAYRQWGKKDAARNAWMELLRINPTAAFPDGTPLGKAIEEL